MNTHPLHGVHGRQNKFSNHVGTVVHVTEGTTEAPAFLYLLLDEPRPDGTMILIIRSTDFIPTDPTALRASLAPRNYAAEASALGTAIAARLLDGSRLSHVLGDVARSAVYAALGDSPPTKLGELAGRIGDGIAATALGSHAVDRRGLLLTMADRIGKAVKS